MPISIENEKENNHLNKASKEIREVYDELRDRISLLGKNIIERRTRKYIAFRISIHFAEVHLQKKRIKLHLRRVEYNDPKNLVGIYPETHGWTLDRWVAVKSIEDIDDVMPIIQRSYKDVI